MAEARFEPRFSIPIPAYFLLYHTDHINAQGLSGILESMSNFCSYTGTELMGTLFSILTLCLVGFIRIFLLFKFSGTLLKKMGNGKYGRNHQKL